VEAALIASIILFSVGVGAALWLLTEDFLERRHAWRSTSGNVAGPWPGLQGEAQMREFNGSLTLVTPPLSAARLIWSRYGNEEGSYPLTVVNNADGTSTVSTDASLPRGVLNLCVTPTDTACCPRWLHVWSDGCPPISTKATHSSSAESEPIPSCEPAPAPAPAPAP
jgi:hypothetical protein